MRTLVSGPVAPPLSARAPIRQPLQHIYQKRPMLSNAGALQYSYESFGVQVNSIFGAGVGMKRGGPIGVGQTPMIALPTQVNTGMQFKAGQFMFSPLGPAVE